MKQKKPTLTATVRELRDLTKDCAEHAHTCAASHYSCLDFKTRTEQLFGGTKDFAEKSRIYADSCREQVTRCEQNRENAYNSANRAELEADNAASYAAAAKYCLLASMLILSAVVIISIFS